MKHVLHALGIALLVCSGCHLLTPFDPANAPEDPPVASAPTPADVTRGNTQEPSWGNPQDAWTSGCGGGCRWTVEQHAATTETLRDIWGSSASDVWVVGAGGTILGRGPSGWVQTSSPVATELQSVEGSAAHASAVGNDGVVLVAEQGQWQQATLSVDGLDKTKLLGVLEFAPDDIWAVGDHGTVLSFDGARWTPESPGTTNNLKAVWAASRDRIWAVGDATAASYDGTGWAAQDTAVDLRAIWGADDGDLWAVGYRGAILRWTGAQWTEVASPTQEHLNGVWGISAKNIWAVGDHGTIVHFDGAAWTNVPSPTSEKLCATWGSGPQSVWAVGYRGTIVHFAP